MELLPRPLGISKSVDAQVSNIKWHSSMHIVGLLYLQTPIHKLKIVQVFTEKHAFISRPGQFKPVFFKGQLYFKLSVSSTASLFTTAAPKSIKEHSPPLFLLDLCVVCH